MSWIDRALATLSPTDVAVRLHISINAATPEQNYAALRRALPRMTALDLAQLAAAFDVPWEAPTAEAAPEMLFDPQERATAVLAHFLTIPDEMNTRLDAFLCGHPRALAYFDEDDVTRLLILQSPRRLAFAPTAVAVAGAAAAAIALGFSLVRVLHI